MLTVVRGDVSSSTTYCVMFHEMLDDSVVSSVSVGRRFEQRAHSSDRKAHVPWVRTLSVRIWDRLHNPVWWRSVVTAWSEAW